MKKLLGISVVLGVLFLAGCNVLPLGMTEPSVTKSNDVVQPNIVEAEPVSQFDDWKTYTNQKIGFTISYPSTYHVYLDNDLINYDEAAYERGNPQGVKIQVQIHGDYLGCNFSSPGCIKQFIEQDNQNRSKSEVPDNPLSTPMTPVSLGIFTYKSEVLNGPGGAFNVYYAFTNGTKFYQVLVWGEANDQENVNNILASFRFIQDETSDWSTYRNEKYGYSFRYPKIGWLVYERDQDRSISLDKDIVRIKAQDDDDSSHVIEVSKEAMTARVQEVVQQRTQSSPTFTRKEIIFLGVPATELSFLVDGMEDYEAKDVLFAYQGDTYYLTGLTKDKFKIDGVDRGIFDAILSTFILDHSEVLDAASVADSAWGIPVLPPGFDWQLSHTGPLDDATGPQERPVKLPGKTYIATVPGTSQVPDVFDYYTESLAREWAHTVIDAKGREFTAPAADGMGGGSVTGALKIRNGALRAIIYSVTVIAGKECMFKVPQDPACPMTIEQRVFISDPVDLDTIPGEAFKG